MTTDTRTNFLGIPVEGDINDGGRTRTDQRPLEELEPLIRAVIDDDGIAVFGWTQYTPYFNDGDPCEFSAGEPWFLTHADLDALKAKQRIVIDEDEDLLDIVDWDHYEYEISGHPTLGIDQWDSSFHKRVTIERDPDTIARYERCRALAKAIGSGEFDDVLFDAFGDHASIRVRRTGISVDEYSHD